MIARVLQISFLSKVFLHIRELTFGKVAIGLHIATTPISSLLFNRPVIHLGYEIYYCCRYFGFDGNRLHLSC